MRSLKILIFSIPIVITLTTTLLFKWIKNPFIAIIIILLLNGIGAFLLFSNKFRIFNKLKKVFKFLSQGNIIEAKELSKTEKNSVLLSALVEFMESLEQIILKMNQVSENVADSSIELSENLQNILENGNDNNHLTFLKDKMNYILENVNKQTAHSEEAAANVTEISESMNKIAERAVTTKNLSEETNKLAEEGEQNIIKNNEKFSTIEKGVNHIEEKAVVLKESSGKIFDIVNMINEITEQTTLLSLNAAIEAARAGEAGRGFSIVAEAVRKLAEDSVKATAQIEDLVHSVQNEISELATLTDVAHKQVQKGREVNDATSNKIYDIIEKIKVINEEVKEMSSSVTEQQNAINDINIAMDQIANRSIDISGLSTEQISETEEIYSTLKKSTNFSANLSEVSDALKNLTNNFSISDDIKIKNKDLIEWKNSYSVKIDSIDDQHKELVRIINNLYKYMIDGKSKKILNKTVSELIDYTVYHFGYEENLFKKINYPETDAHKKEHKSFVDEMLAFQRQLEAGEIMISNKLLNFLKNWLLNHIGKSDKKYSPYLKEHNIK